MVPVSCLCPHLTSRMQVCPLHQAFFFFFTLARQALYRWNCLPAPSDPNSKTVQWSVVPYRARGSGDRQWCWLYGFVGTPTAIGLNSKVVSMVSFGLFKYSLGYMYLFACVCTRAMVCMWESVLSFYHAESQGQNSSCQPWWPVPLLTEPSHSLCLVCFSFLSPFLDF